MCSGSDTFVAPVGYSTGASSGRLAGTGASRFPG